MRETLKETGVPEPEFEFDTFFTVTFRRPVTKNVGVNVGVKIGIKGKQLERINAILTILRRKEILNIAQLAEVFSVSRRTIERDMELLKEKELIKFIGAPKTGRYILTEKGRKLWEE